MCNLIFKKYGKPFFGKNQGIYLGIDFQDMDRDLMEQLITEENIEEIIK